MNDCMWAVFYVRDEGENQENSGESLNSQKYRRSLKLRKPDFKTSQTLPQNSLKFHCCKTGKQNPGIKYIHWNLLRTNVHVFSDSVLCLGNNNAIANQVWTTKAV